MTVMAIAIVAVVVNVEERWNFSVCPSSPLLQTIYKLGRP